MATIDETLRSVRAQTHRNLEILVVDDGSDDETARIAEEHAQVDPRLRVIKQANGGVAAARNTGILAAKGELIAPIDADDAWAPTKVARQVTLMRRNPNATLCYTWWVCIDQRGRFIGYGGRHTAHGDALLAMCCSNLVGNGSGAMMRKHAAVAAGLYDASLRARGAQGCEDYKLYLNLAAAGDVLVVPEFLTSYRITPNNMSSDVVQMCRSHLIVIQEFAAQHPRLAPVLEQGRRTFGRWLLMRALRQRRLGKIPALFRTLAREDRRAALALAAAMPAFFADRAASRIRRIFSARRDHARAPQELSAGTVDT
jgi:glycosyltransferase involved in cell wall biosynthesis